MIKELVSNYHQNSQQIRYKVNNNNKPQSPASAKIRNDHQQKMFTQIRINLKLTANAF